MANIRTIERILGRFCKRRILVIGEIMLDKFIKGSVSRISPEAPVPVVKVKEESEILGGAGNVANNLRELGAEVSLVTFTGNDISAKHIIEICKEKGISTENILSTPRTRTIEKTRIIAEHQQVVRFDTDPVNLKLTFEENSRILKILEQKICERVDAVLLSDYGKGMFSPFLISEIIKTAGKSSIPVYVDPKAEHFKRYKRVTCVTPNITEAFSGMHLPIKHTQSEVEKLGIKIVKSLALKSLLITQGENGMTLFVRDKQKISVKHISAKAKEVYDVTGAGDTVISVFALSLAAKASFADAAFIANCAAGIVVGKLGTATTSPTEILNYIKNV